MESHTPLPEPSGTVAIEDNWSRFRKVVTFAFASLYTLATFVLPDIATVVWVQLNAELGISWSNLNSSFAVNHAGLATDCILIVPFAVTYGRRSVYILSSAMMNTTAELLAINAINAINGFAGAVNETLVQMTIVDIFFGHQCASANAFYNFMFNTGPYIAPVAVDLVLDIRYLGHNSLLFLFAFEETRYIPTFLGEPGNRANRKSLSTFPDAKSGRNARSADEPITAPEPYRRNSYRERLALITETDNPIWENVKRPLVVLLSSPAVTFTAFEWGCFLSWFSIIATTQSSYFALPPYNYNSSQIGLFNLLPFIGDLIGCVLSGPINDWYVLWRAKRNNRVFEPETRLHMGLPAIFATPVGLLVFGIGLARVSWMHRRPRPGVFEFAMFCTGAWIIGNALGGVAFTQTRYQRMAVLQQGPRTV
ncbi:major facilitator superfamily domain-containing protein [Aspergillus fruticulosus]